MTVVGCFWLQFHRSGNYAFSNSFSYCRSLPNRKRKHLTVFFWKSFCPVFWSLRKSTGIFFTDGVLSDDLSVTNTWKLYRWVPWITHEITVARNAFFCNNELILLYVLFVRSSLRVWVAHLLWCKQRIWKPVMDRGYTSCVYLKTPWPFKLKSYFSDPCFYNRLMFDLAYPSEGGCPVSHSL